jgi:hypothetical protein
MDDRRDENTNLFHRIADDISGRETRLWDMAERSDNRMTAMKQAHNEAERRKMSGWWTLVAFASAYAKMLSIVRQHFSSDEARNSLFGATLSLLAVARYMFEMIVWLKTLEKDAGNGLLFRFRTVTVDLQHRQNARNETEREITRFIALGIEERELRAEVMNDKSLDQKGLEFALEDVEREIDGMARSQFSIYARWAGEFSYDAAAQTMRTEILPRLDAQILELEAERTELQAGLTAAGINSGWKWFERARAVGMEEQYDFFYRYSSRLLHAEPVSFATHQPDLESYEVAALLDHILASIEEAAAVGRTVLPRFPQAPRN